MATYYLAQHRSKVPQHNEQRRDGTRFAGLIVVHTAENATVLSGADSGAQAVAQYILGRDDHGSYHAIVDADTILHMAHPEWETFHCRYTNRWSYGIAVAIRSADWPALEEVRHGDWSRAEAILDNLARAAADAVDYALTEHGVTVPLKRISRSEALAGKPGFVAHADTDPDRRSDPGKDFNWDFFFARIKHHARSQDIEEDTVVTMANPAVGRVTSEYGWRGAISASIGRMLHAGIDIANAVGTPVRAAFAGTVVGAGWGIVGGRTGNGVLIQNPDGESQYYGHLDTISVRKGDKVGLGEQIGTMGATGNVTGPHLHFEVWDTHGRPMNPRIAFNSHKVTPGVHNLTAQSVGAGVGSGAKDKTTAPVRVRKAYYTRRIDGEAGPFTIRALQLFLADRGMYERVIDGKLGTYTWAGLQEYLTVDRFYTRRVDGDPGQYTIRAMQTWLQKAGFYERAIDGMLGVFTWAALQGFLAKERWVTIR